MRYDYGDSHRMTGDELDLIKRAVEHATVRSGSKHIRAECPICPIRTGKRDKRLSLALNTTNGWFSCWKCKVRGRLDGWAAAHPDDIPDDFEIVEKMVAPEGFVELSDPSLVDSMSADSARAFLRRRRVPAELWDECRMGICLAGKFIGRVIIPVFDIRGDWVGWVGRSWARKPLLPYIYPRGMERGNVLFNVAALTADHDMPVIVVEGVFDALRMWPHAVAVLGKPSHDHVRMIAEQANRPVAVLLDGDAHEEGWALANNLRLLGVKAGSVALPPGMDPDTCDPDELREQARACVA